LVQVSGKTEIGDFGGFELVDEDVARGQVSVANVLGVEEAHAGRDVPAEFDQIDDEIDLGEGCRFGRVC